MAESSEDRDLTLLVTRGFAGVTEQLRERDKNVARLSEDVVRIESDLKAVNATLARIDASLTQVERDALQLRVSNLEKQLDDFKKKQDSNASWIRGLLVSVLLLLLGVIFNFMSAHMK